jgi:hypothetical protein
VWGRGGAWMAALPDSSFLETAEKKSNILRSPKTATVVRL